MTAGSSGVDLVTRDSDLEVARRAIATAERVVFFTGAGMSAESGIPTFRGPDGLWRGHRPEELATPEAFRADPERVTTWYRWRRSVIAAAPLHPGHRAVAEHCLSHPSAVVVTQNVDGLHQRAGCPTVEELHGSIWEDRCARCGDVAPLDPADPVPAESDPLPRCPCGGLRRPGVVWFGESLPAATVDRAVEALSGADLVLIVGTSAVVQPAASLVRRAPRTAVRITVDPSPPSGEGTHLLGAAGAILPRILA